MISKDSFCRQIKEYETAMYAVAFSVVQNDADAAEVLSEAIYRAYAHLADLKTESYFKAWILKIVHHTAVEYVRKNARYTSLEDTEQDKENSVDLTTKLALKEAVGALQQPYRTVVILYYYEGFSTAKIAEITETKESAVRKQLSRARRMLKELLKEDFLHA